MNALAEKYGDKVNILAFPCNQFGHQTNEGDEEFLNTLKHVRPGNGFELKPEITVFSKADVNGASAMPLFKWLKSELMIPAGEKGDTKENGCDDIDALILPRGGFGGTTIALWTPVCRSDIAWNFEKFLVGPDGAAVKRYSRYFEIGGIADDIDALL
jgi:glutathione peroxidase